jgi:endonuclease III
MERKELFEKVIEYFKVARPVAESELDYKSPYQLLVAVILSAQCTDKRVNKITPPFFERFPTPFELAQSEVSEIFEYIKTCSYPNNKAKHLLGMAQTLVSEFNGIVPSEVADLQRLSGVGRKTANVVVSVAFGKPAMAVDTHVFRVAARIGLTINAKNPLDTEQQLVDYFPNELLAIAHHWLILHGRYVCLARKPKCEECGLTQWCKHFNMSK